MEVNWWLWMLCSGCPCGIHNWASWTSGNKVCAGSIPSMTSQGTREKNKPSTHHPMKQKPKQTKPSRTTQTGLEHASLPRFFAWAISWSILNTFFAQIWRPVPHSHKNTGNFSVSTSTSILSNFLNYSPQLPTQIHFNLELRASEQIVTAPKPSWHTDQGVTYKKTPNNIWSVWFHFFSLEIIAPSIQLL